MHRFATEGLAGQADSLRGRVCLRRIPLRQLRSLSDLDRAVVEESGSIGAGVVLIHQDRAVVEESGSIGAGVVLIHQVGEYLHGDRCGNGPIERPSPSDREGLSHAPVSPAFGRDQLPPASTINVPTGLPGVNVVWPLRYP
jgi:hypothetical protein